ncbi:hypothetical protein CLV59_101463 [Chitinophaga dinghuensis]|uniref:Uncharacterized protein n=2 Tax=Chitinophaga dinghuensis TaxID=1539050 RepID=A0A327WCS2_9BACT|nr:hypothetical protein CLV59_101463 [Chitinophaga dinghuensis]
MITSVNFETYTASRKSVTIDYGTWKQQQDTIYITCATGLGKNDTQRFLLSADKQKLIRFSSGQAIDTSKNTIYRYHPGAECPFEVREKIRLKVYDLGHL